MLLLHDSIPRDQAFKGSQMFICSYRPGLSSLSSLSEVRGQYCLLNTNGVKIAVLWENTKVISLGTSRRVWHADQCLMWKVEFSQRMQTGLHCTNGIIRSRSTTAVFLKVSLGKNCCQAFLGALLDGGCLREELHQSISPTDPDHFVGCGIWLWAFWKSESCKELLSLHDHKRHNSSAKWWYKPARITEAFIRYFAFSSQILRVLINLKLIVIVLKNHFPAEGEDKIMQFEYLFSLLPKGG